MCCQHTRDACVHPLRNSASGTYASFGLRATRWKRSLGPRASRKRTRVSTRTLTRCARFASEVVARAAQAGAARPRQAPTVTRCLQTAVALDALTALVAEAPEAEVPARPG